jgi:very-short-patch-repair endonuclease
MEHHVGIEVTAEGDVEVARVASLQGGSVSILQLRAAGLGDGGIRHRVRCGRLHWLQPRVYAVGHRNVGWYGRLWAAVLSTDGVASHRAAARIQRALPQNQHVEVTAHARRRRGVILHRSVLPPDQIVYEDGLPVTTFARTAVDCADVLDTEQLIAFLHEAEVQRCDFTRLDQLMATANGRRGIGRLREARARFGDGAAREGVERAFAELVRLAGLPLGRRNQRVLGMTVDYLWPELKLVVELDSVAFHRTARKLTTDRARDRRLHLAGYAVLRFMHSDIEHRAEEVVADLRAAIAMRAAAQSSTGIGSAASPGPSRAGSACAT